MDGAYQGVTYRPSPSAVSLQAAGQQLWLLLENMGRINYGHGMTDPKVLQQERCCAPWPCAR